MSEGRGVGAGDRREGTGGFPLRWMKGEGRGCPAGPDQKHEMQVSLVTLVTHVRLLLQMMHIDVRSCSLMF